MLGSSLPGPLNKREGGGQARARLSGMGTGLRPGIQWAFHVVYFIFCIITQRDLGLDTQLFWASLSSSIKVR